jgi:Flp pilus assembly protein TadB
VGREAIVRHSAGAQQSFSTLEHYREPPPVIFAMTPTNPFSSPIRPLGCGVRGGAMKWKLFQLVFFTMLAILIMIVAWHFHPWFVLIMVAAMGLVFRYYKPPQR